VLKCPPNGKASVANAKFARVLSKYQCLRKKRLKSSQHSRRWMWILLGASLVPLGGVVAAIRATTFPEVDLRAAVQTVVEELPGSSAVVTNLGENQLFSTTERVTRGDTLSSVFTRLRIEDADGQRTLARSAIARSGIVLSPGSTLTALVSATGSLKSLIFRGDSARLRWDRTSSGFSQVTVASDVQRRVVMKSGTIVSSLFAATDNADVPDAIASSFADIFSEQVDLQRGIKPGDRFSVVYEVLHIEGEEERPSRILAAEFLNQGRLLQAFHFDSAEKDKAEYFSPDGRNLKRVFLTSPIEFSRVTSGFSSVRLHPVLQVWRAHKGIDFGAPIGSRVRATGDGYVKSIGWQNGYGKTVVIQHARGFSTLYGHLSAFPPSLAEGSRVHQGDVIGFVGMTGMSTGPHLHYEFHVNGSHVDPARYAAEQRQDVPASRRALFRDSVLAAQTALNALRTVDVAATE